MYKYVLNSVVKISMMFAKYFEYYTIIHRGPFFRGHAVLVEIYISLLYGLRDGRAIKQRFTLFNQGLYKLYYYYYYYYYNTENLPKTAVDCELQ